MKVSKASLVRTVIAEAKREGRGPEDCEAEAMALTGHSRGLTRAYIRDNWAQVPEPHSTNAERVRGRIAYAKRVGEDQESVILWATATLEQSRDIARKYVRENWPKVLVD